MTVKIDYDPLTKEVDRIHDELLKTDAKYWRIIAAYLREEHGMTDEEVVDELGPEPTPIQ
jgi:hypothetical protein